MTFPAPAESTRADWKEIAHEKGLMMLDRSGLILPNTIELQTVVTPCKAYGTQIRDISFDLSTVNPDKV
jgi:hypothetical protein